MKNLTREEARELNELFYSKKFKEGMSDLDLFTTISGINSKRISPNGDNLRLLTSNKRVKRMVGKFINSSKTVLNIIAYDENNNEILRFDFNCSNLYSNSKKGDKQFGDISENGEVHFRGLIGNIFIPQSRCIGFKFLYK